MQSALEPSASAADEGAEWCAGTSTRKRWAEWRRSSLTAVKTAEGHVLLPQDNRTEQHRIQDVTHNHNITTLAIEQNTHVNNNLFTCTTHNRHNCLKTSTCVKYHYVLLKVIITTFTARFVAVFWDFAVHPQDLSRGPFLALIVIGFLFYSVLETCLWH